MRMSIFFLFLVCQGGTILVQEIIEQFKNFVKNRGWTQQEIAEKIGCSRAHVSRLLNGERNPSLKILTKMEDVMKNE